MYYMTDEQYERMQNYYKEKTELLDRRGYKHNPIQKARLEAHLHSMKLTFEILHYSENEPVIKKTVFIDRLGLTHGLSNTLRANGVKTVYDLSKFTQFDIECLHGIGKKRLEIIKDVMNHFNVNFKD